MFGWFRQAIAVAAGRSSKWPAIRADHLRREPRCVACGTSEHLNVHHVRPFQFYPELELKDTDDQLVTLCETPDRECHRLFGHGGNFRLWNPNARRDAMRYRQLIEGCKSTRE